SSSKIRYSKPANGRDCVKTQTTSEPNVRTNHKDTKAQRRLFKKLSKILLSVSVLVSWWFNLPHFVLSNRLFTQSRQLVDPSGPFYKGAALFSSARLRAGGRMLPPLLERI